jgi:hypothetical protein
MIWILAAVSVVVIAVAAFSYLEVLRQLEKQAFGDRPDASRS